MTSGAVLAAARRTIMCRHFGLQFFLQAGRQVESPYALCTVPFVYKLLKGAFDVPDRRLMCLTWKLSPGSFKQQVPLAFCWISYCEPKNL